MLSANYKLFFKYIFFKKCGVFFKTLTTYPSSHILIPSTFLMFLVLHLKLSSVTPQTQLIDICVYEVPYATILDTPILVYTFRSLTFKQILQVTLVNFIFNEEGVFSSISEVFPNVEWLERECAELHGIFFNYKKDLRNLLLPYNDSSFPFQKIAPSVGFFEYWYDTTNDFIRQTPVTLQF